MYGVREKGEPEDGVGSGILHEVKSIPCLCEVNEVRMIYNVITYPTFPFLLPRTWKEREKGGKVSVETLLPLNHQGERVAVSSGFDHSQVSFRVGDVKPVKSGRPTNRGVRGSVEEGVGVTRDVPEEKFVNKLIPLGPRGVREGGGGILLTFNEVEIASQDSVLRFEVGEGLPEESDLFFLSTGLVTRGSEKADVDKEEGEIRTGKEEEKS